MAPGYNPLGIPAQALPSQLFGQVPQVSMEDYEKAQALQRAQELTNQNNALTVAQNQRIADEAQALQEYGKTIAPETYDPNEFLKRAQIIAATSGDAKGVIDFARAQNTLGVKDPLTAEEAILYQERGVPAHEGMSRLVAQGLISAGHLNIRENDPNRQLSADIKQRQLDGTMPTKVSDTELGKIQSADQAISTISQVNTLLSQLDPGALSALKAGKVTDLYKDPGSPAYRMYANLDLLKKQVARMNDSGALTQLDVDMFAPLTTGSPIYDDPASLSQRMQDLYRYIAGKKERIIKTNEQGYRNMDRFKNPDALAQSLVDGASKTAPFQVPGKTFVGMDPSGLPIFKKGQ